VVSRGQLHAVWFPVGHDAAPEQQYKRRPVLVVGTAVGDWAALCAQVTANPQRFHSPGPGDVPIADWDEAGLPRECTVRAFRLWTAEPRHFADQHYGDVGTSVMDAVMTHVRTFVEGAL